MKIKQQMTRCTKQAGLLRLVLAPAIFCLILFTGACFDFNILNYQGQVEVIAGGQGCQAPGFKMGLYTDFSLETQEKEENKSNRIKIAWDRELKEYEVYTNGSHSQENSNFRLMELMDNHYLLQNREENHYIYAVILIAGDIVDFLDIKEEHEEKLEELIKQNGLAVNKDELSGTPEGFISFFMDLVRLNYLKSGERIKYIGVHETHEKHEKHSRKKTQKTQKN